MLNVSQISNVSGATSIAGSANHGLRRQNRSRRPPRLRRERRLGVARLRLRAQPVDIVDYALGRFQLLDRARHVIGVDYRVRDRAGDHRILAPVLVHTVADGEAKVPWRQFLPAVDVRAHATQLLGPHGHVVLVAEAAARRARRRSHPPWINCQTDLAMLAISVSGSGGIHCVEL